MVSDGMRPFFELGLRVEDAFRREHYAEAAFSALARSALENAGLHEHFDLAEMVRFGLTATLPEQHDPRADFGQPPLTLWRGRRCALTILVWRSSTTAIHQHGFTGAFQVLSGGSVHARFSYRERASLGEDIGAGDLSCTEIERLGRGDVRAIHESDRGIHSLFHLEHPSVSLVLRTIDDLRFAMQHAYYRPGLRVFDARDEPEQMRMVQLSRMLARTSREKTRDVMSDVLRSAAAIDAFRMLDEIAIATDAAFATSLLEQAKARFEPLTSAFVDALRERERVRFMESRRESVHDPDLRFLIAVLMNAPSRRHALDLVQRDSGTGSPHEALANMIGRLGDVKMKLQAGGLPWEPSVFGLPEPDEASIAALRLDLAGETVPATSPLPFYDAVRKHPSFSILFGG